MAEPIKIGVLKDFIFIGPEGDALRQLDNAVKLRFEEAANSGEIDRPVEAVIEAVQGLPHGTAKNVCDVWNRLAAAGVLAIVGPGITDNALAVKPLAEAARVPTINFTGCSRSRGEFNFHYQIGSLQDDPLLIARLLDQKGIRSVAVVRDRSPIGAEFFQSFADGADTYGISILSDQKVSPLNQELDAEARKAKDAKPDALVYLGLGQVLTGLSQSLRNANWDPPRFTTAAGMNGWISKETRVAFEGWVYVDLVDEENAVYQGLFERYQARFGEPLVGPIGPGAYDMASLVAQGLKRATVLTPEGVKDGLEQVHMVPSALGGAGTVMGFGPWERTALKGPDYLIFRQHRGGESLPYREYKRFGSR